MSGIYHHAIIHPPQVSIDKTVRIVINRKKTVPKPGDPDPAELIVIYSNGCSTGIILKSKIFYDQNEPEWLLIQKKGQQFRFCTNTVNILRCSEQKK
jgi:hypothetical protein